MSWSTAGLISSILNTLGHSGRVLTVTVPASRRVSCSRKASTRPSAVPLATARMSRRCRDSNSSWMNQSTYSQI